MSSIAKAFGPDTGLPLGNTSSSGRDLGQWVGAQHAAPCRAADVTAMRVAHDPAEQAKRILDVISDLGLEPYTPAKPLPIITPDDVPLLPATLALQAVMGAAPDMNLPVPLTTL